MPAWRKPGRHSHSLSTTWVGAHKLRFPCCVSTVPAFPPCAWHVLGMCLACPRSSTLPTRAPQAPFLSPLRMPAPTAGSACSRTVPCLVRLLHTRPAPRVPLQVHHLLCCMPAACLPPDSLAACALAPAARSAGGADLPARPRAGDRGHAQAAAARPEGARLRVCACMLHNHAHRLVHAGKQQERGCSQQQVWAAAHWLLFRSCGGCGWSWASCLKMQCLRSPGGLGVVELPYGAHIAAGLASGAPLLRLQPGAFHLHLQPEGIKECTARLGLHAGMLATA